MVTRRAQHGPHKGPDCPFVGCPIFTLGAALFSQYAGKHFDLCVLDACLMQVDPCHEAFPQRKRDHTV